MGAALARALRAGGRSVAVWNRDASKAAPLAAVGVHVCSTLEDAVGASGCIVVCVTRYATWTQLANALPAGALDGRTVVQLSNGAPDEAKALRDLHARLGAASLDGSILGWPSQVGSPKFPITVSGDAQAFARVAPVLAPLGDVQLVGEDISASSGLEAALLFFTNASLVCYLQSAALLRAAGVSHTAFSKRLGAVLPVVEWLVGESDKAIAANDHRGTEATLLTYHQSFVDLQNFARRAHTPDGLIAAFTNVMQQAIDAGRGNEELSALYEVLRPARG